ncbi:hypothetical protein [Coxiella-like endosymbiont]|uniref:hypothetical protein n=1 Tax=Coxiella-like endosymbiont TaxID=1592897 RepID=UPI002868BD8C|nr:hypothetical protein [Coxiella-like endosymbiont]
MNARKFFGKRDLFKGVHVGRGGHYHYVMRRRRHFPPQHRLKVIPSLQLPDYRG